MKFECKKCGWCCKDFGEFHYLPVYEWEKEILIEEAEKRSIKLSFKVIDDEKTVQLTEEHKCTYFPENLD